MREHLAAAGPAAYDGSRWSNRVEDAHAEVGLVRFLPKTKQKNNPEHVGFLVFFPTDRFLSLEKTEKMKTKIPNQKSFYEDGYFKTTASENHPVSEVVVLSHPYL